MYKVEQQLAERLLGVTALVFDYRAFDPFIWDRTDAVARDVSRILEQEADVFTYESPFAGVVHLSVRDEELKDTAQKLESAGYLIHGCRTYREGESYLFFGQPAPEGVWVRGQAFRLEFFTPHYQPTRNEVQLYEFERRVSDLINDGYSLHRLIGAGDPQQPMCAVLLDGTWE